MICYVCDADEKWKSMGSFSTEGELLICTVCGNCCYRVNTAEEAKMLEFYRKGYRPPPTHVNILTTTNKLNYVKVFLADLLRERDPRTTGKPMIVGDVGCATGYLPAFFRRAGHKATGSEYTTTFRRFAEHYYGIPVTEELTPKHKYDLITIYHVLEHMMVPDKKLAQFRDLLADDGMMMVATPEWLDVLEESSGTSMHSFEHLFPKPHINVFTKQSLQNLFAKVGLEIVKEDHIQYGQTYLLKKTDPKITADKIVYEPAAKIEEKLVRTKEAINLYRQGKFEEAARVWPKFPEAWLSQVQRNHKSPDQQADLFEKMKPLLSDNIRTLLSLGSWLYQMGKYEDSLQVWKQVVAVKPNADSLVFMGWCFGHLKQHDNAMGCFQKAIEMNPMRWQELTDWICQQACEQPSWDEVLRKEMEAKVLAANPVLVPPPVDPIMAEQPVNIVTDDIKPGH